MIQGLMLASVGFGGSYYGGTVGQLLAMWQQAGVFSYILPFLLIFAMVFGILSQTNMFKGNRVINGILALAVALLALQFDFVPVFFSQIFPRLGVGLAVLMAILILFGLFIDPKHNGVKWMMLGVGLIITIIVIVSTFNYLGYGQWWGFLYNYSPWIISIVIFVVIIGVIIGAGSPKRQFAPYNPYLVMGVPQNKP